MTENSGKLSNYLDYKNETSGKLSNYLDNENETSGTSDNRRFYNSKTSCFGSVEGLSFTLNCHTFHTKTSCFGSVMLSDTFLITITLPNKLTFNTLVSKVTLSSKTSHKIQSVVY